MALALPILIGLGIWQLQRMHWKEAMLAGMEASAGKPLLDLGSQPLPEDAAFRHVRVALDCPTAEPGAEAGRNLHGDAGWAFALDCRDSAGAKVQLVIGWGIRPEAWKGAALPHGATEAQGVVAPGAVAKWRITATKATPPLGEAAPPTPADIPNNHFAYAIQWFAFAGVLLLIYTLLVRRWRLASAGGNE